MDAKKFYTHLYKLLDDVTPIKADCGKLCGGACCEGDEETGMYLFPHEEVMYSGKEKWIKIEDSEFIFRGKPVKIAICTGKCVRHKRPLSCRIFPLFLDNNGAVVHDKRGNGLCPLVTAKIPLGDFDPEFIGNVKRVFNILNRFTVTKEYLAQTRELIEEYDELNNIFEL